MKGFMKELKPENLEDLIAGISLYRPGPMDFIPRYLKGKNDKASIAYECPQLEPILAPTYGCIVYQEQVMQIVRDLAGYTLGYLGTKRPGAPCDGKEKSGSHGERTPEFRLRQCTRGRKGLYCEWDRREDGEPYLR